MAIIALLFGRPIAAQQACATAPEVARRIVGAFLSTQRGQPWLPSLGITAGRIEDVQPLADNPDAALCRRMDSTFAPSPGYYFRAGRYILGTSYDSPIPVTGIHSEVIARLVLVFDSAGTRVKRPLRRPGTAPVGGLHLGSPAILSLAMGASRELWRKGADDIDEARSLFFMFEPGVNAGRLSVGYDHMVGALFFGTTARLTALRIWHGGSVGSFVGAEASMLVFTLQGRIGVFREIGAEGTPRARITGDVGVGW